MPIFDAFYGPEEAPETKELGQKSHEASTRSGARPTPREGALALWEPRGPP